MVRIHCGRRSLWIQAKEASGVEVMRRADEPPRPVQARVAIVNPHTLEVAWSNDAADHGRGAPQGRSLEDVVELTASLALPDAVAAVAADGEPRHRAVDLVSTSRGSVQVLASAYRLPDGNVMVVVEKSWQQGRSGHGGVDQQKRRR